MTQHSTPPGIRSLSIHTSTQPIPMIGPATVGIKMHFRHPTFSIHQTTPFTVACMIRTIREVLLLLIIRGLIRIEPLRYLVLHMITHSLMVIRLYQTMTSMDFQETMLSSKASNRRKARPFPRKHCRIILGDTRRTMHKGCHWFVFSTFRSILVTDPRLESSNYRSSFGFQKAFSLCVTSASTDHSAGLESGVIGHP